ncbi:glycoside hydrolase family 55 protein [Polychaeton citri CBS 116435]|uniref:Glycoside hydrolase family 55 protein n=1 Tax=Polychaeton citri CBS 116435 TaxID=1314669 RepID=A0A9P4QBJ6_9PEZI|nr:glycoside hydrolase family 55 protein [Polychaeton citri CBS 116435]
MVRCSSAVLLLAATGITAAQHVHFEIPEVEEYVSSVLSEYSQYTGFNGPPRTYWSHHPRPTNTYGPGHPWHPKPTDECDYWYADVKHQGIAAFNADPAGYEVYRSVKDYGAKGDGVTDDTAAINSAISSGGRCGPGTCESTTVTPAVVYFPPGVYMVNDSIIDYYYTQLVGNPNCLPTIRAFPGFHGGLGVIDGDQYGAGGLGFGATNIFWRQIRNFIIDMTLVPANFSVTGIHWPTGQATSIQNVVFNMASAPGTQHQGIFIEEGSGGFVNDLVFNGGNYGLNVGNQQFTMRNLTFNSVVTAINQLWDWGWTYKSISINNCTTGLNMTGGGPTAQSVGSITFIDSSISNTKTGIATSWSRSSQPPGAGSLILENVDFRNVGVAVLGANGVTALAGGSLHVDGWGEGHAYTPNGPQVFQGYITPVSRPASLLSGSKYYERSKPQYEKNSVRDFVSARDLGAKGDGHTDDTKALQHAINTAVSRRKILFIDHGDYIVTKTIYIPGGSRIVGESFSVILSRGSYFSNMASPKPIVQIGKAGEYGVVEMSDLIVSTQGQQQGAIVFEYNLASPASQPSGLWDVHARIGGFAGSNLQLAQCPTTPDIEVTASNLDRDCIANFMTMHITKSATGVYLENDWIWVADHDVEDPALTQITIYAGRGLLIESEKGNIWLVGTAVEHHVLYEYQFAGASTIFAGQIQTETAYYQPNPSAPLPFGSNPYKYDPPFTQGATITTNGTEIPAADGWGLRIVDSSDILIYGAGLYSFFDNYSTACSAQGNGQVCQNRIFSIEGDSSGINVYNENTVGSHYMVTIDGEDVALWADNQDNFVNTIALFRYNAGGLRKE